MSNDIVTKWFKIKCIFFSHLYVCDHLIFSFYEQGRAPYWIICSAQISGRWMRTEEGWGFYIIKQCFCTKGEKLREGIWGKRKISVHHLCSLLCLCSYGVLQSYDRVVMVCYALLQISNYEGHLDGQVCWDWAMHNCHGFRGYWWKGEGWGNKFCNQVIDFPLPPPPLFLNWYFCMHPVNWHLLQWFISICKSYTLIWVLWWEEDGGKRIYKYDGIIDLIWFSIFIYV